MRFFTWLFRLLREFDEDYHRWFAARHKQEGERPDARALWSAELLEVLIVFPFDDPVAQYLEKYEPAKHESYMAARQEFWNAWRSKRLPAQWAQDIIRLYRGVYAFSMEYEAAVGNAALEQVRQEMWQSLRDRSRRPSAEWQAIVNRPQLPN